MKKVYWLRRIAVLLASFGLGIFVNAKNIPAWLILAYPTVVMLWLMIYDEALFEQNMKRRGKRHDSRRKASSVPMQELQ
ncbi:hypothetical protein IGJ28_000724 [Enterococcus sp. AZ091]|uniref:hypothetical protein n=1 Tax=Enterococcus sp. AZ091 TaxID=2774720 RepID=UPI003F26C09E